MTKEQIKEKAEFIALGTFLSSWPDNLSFDEVLESMERLGVYDLDDDGISIWQPFEDYPPNEVSDHILTLHDHIIQSFTL